MTKPTPLLLRVGAKHSTCSGKGVAKVGVVESAEHDAVSPEELGAADLLQVRPFRRAVGGQVLRLAGAPDGDPGWSKPVGKRGCEIV